MSFTTSYCHKYFEISLQTPAFTMDNDLRSQLDTMLQRILSCSMEYLERIPPKSELFTGQSNDRIHSIALPEPPSLLSAMLNIGAPISVAQEMQHAYRQRATELKKRYEIAAFQATLALSQGPGPSSSPSLQHKLLSTFKKLYVSRLDDWQKACLSLYKSCTATSSSQGDHLKRGRGTHMVFNFEYVPLLEHFFEENPFPTHAEKVLLAKKSGMTYRQIHVWFQNKRTRSRKDGKGSRKETVLNLARFPVDSRRDVAKQCMKQNDGSDICSGQLPSQGQAMTSSGVQIPLDAPAPPYAFPSTYPPPPGYKPFQDNSSLRSHSLLWRRRLSSVRSPSLHSTTVSDLAEMFSQLSVRDNHGHQFQHVPSARTQEIGAAVSSITVKPFSAPLFATCRPVEFVTKAVFVPLPTVPAPPTLLHPFRTPSPQAQLVTLIPSTVQKTPRHGRKVAPLPKRLPQVSIKTKHNLMLSTLDYSDHRSRSSASSVRSSSSELSPSVATTPEVGSPFLPDKVSPTRESRNSEDLRPDSFSASNHIHSAISEILVPQGNSSAIMRVMRRAVPPPRARLPLCVGSCI